LRQAFLQPDQIAARQAWRSLADSLRSRGLKLGALMDDSEDNVLAYHLQRLTNEVQRGAGAVGTFPSAASLIQRQHCYMGVEAAAELMYWPKTEPPSLLPIGKGAWQPPGIVKVG
jgi:hypothetical protein